MTEHLIHAVGKNGAMLLRLALSDDGDRCRIACTIGGKQHVAVSGDFFEALRILREQFLEPMDLIPHCYGASVNVWPSAMARSMGQGLSAYRLELGQTGGELLDIFATGDDVEPATSAEQKRFMERWLASTPG